MTQEINMQSLKKDAARGNANAQFVLGYLHFIGQGIRKDRQRSVLLWTKAAEQGHPESQYWLGICYYTGIAVTKDITTAIQYWKTSAHNGYIMSQMAITTTYLFHKGTHCQIKKEEALKYCREAAFKGNEIARQLLINWFHVSPKES